MLLAEVVGVEEEGDAELAGGGGVIRAGVGEEGVALLNHCFGEELAEVSESDDGDFELGGGGEAFGEVGLVVVGLGGVEGADGEEGGGGGAE